MKQALREIAETIPYNSFGNLITKKGLVYPPAFGGNCILQLKELATKLIEKEHNPKYLGVTEGEGRHYAAVCEEDGDLFYLDPFLLQTDPLNITKALRNRITVATDSLHPVDQETRRKVLLHPVDDEKFIVEWYATAASGHRFYHQYPYDLNGLNDNPPAADEPATFHTQRRLKMRVLRPDGDLMKIRLDTHTGLMDIQRVGKRPSMQRMGKNQFLFLREFDKVTKILRVKRYELMQFFYTGLGEYSNTFEISETPL